MIEIGSYTGDSTAIFAKYFDTVYAIDPWESNIGGITNSVDMKSVYDLFCKHTSGKNIIAIRDHSSRVYDLFRDESVDFVYIDGLHTYKAVMEDIRHYKSKVRKGGYLGGHDYHRMKFPGVVKAVDECFEHESVHTFRDTSWAVRL